MAAQVFDESIDSAVNPVMEMFREGLQKTMKLGVQNTADVAKESGAPKLIANCEALEESTDGMNKVFDSLVESLEKYLAYSRKSSEALGV